MKAINVNFKLENYEGNVQTTIYGLPLNLHAISGFIVDISPNIIILLL